ncbi:MAG: ATP-binding protein [Cyclobacteriaceae bacterium]|nr:ATP-binding protein [Cyclobacteriaceae bacterium]
MNLSFKNRVAFHYMIATAIIMAVVFSVVYFIVQSTVYIHLDNDLSYEAEKHTDEIKMKGDSIQFINKKEWEEREHREIQVNPVFIQIIDKKGRLMDKSPNLKDDFLPFKKEKFGGHFDAFLNERAIRQVQIPIEKDGEIRGYILAAMSSESSQSVILKLRNVLFLSYLFLLVGLYFISRFLAGRSIIPIKYITETINRITKNNLNERVDLPHHIDELHDLSSGFNQLLQRIENAIQRERQFTSDASHELRTPLATLRGTLEVLIRRPRSQKEYEDKISYSLSEIDRMTSSIEQLLLLARLDAHSHGKIIADISLPTLINETLSRHQNAISDKNLKVDLHIQTTKEALVPQYYSNLIIDNIISNAIKYSLEKTSLEITVLEKENTLVCTIKDQGIGIKKEDVHHLFDNFFRSNALHHKHISGNGLGLSIAKKSADAIQASLLVESILGKGTTFTITF